MGCLRGGTTGPPSISSKAPWMQRNAPWDWVIFPTSPRAVVAASPVLQHPFPSCLRETGTCSQAPTHRSIPFTFQFCLRCLWFKLVSSVRLEISVLHAFGGCCDCWSVCGSAWSFPLNPSVLCVSWQGHTGCLQKSPWTGVSKAWAVQLWGLSVC